MMTMQNNQRTRQCSQIRILRLLMRLLRKKFTRRRKRKTSTAPIHQLSPRSRTSTNLLQHPKSSPLNPSKRPVTSEQVNSFPKCQPDENEPSVNPKCPSPLTPIAQTRKHIPRHTPSRKRNVSLKTRRMRSPRKKVRVKMTRLLREER